MPDHLITISGTVQGVGFRPFVAHTAARLGVRGWVRNDLRGVELRALAPADALAAFAHALRHEAPPAATITGFSVRPIDGGANPLPPPGETFAILPSTDSAAESAGAVTVAATPDLALCPDCRCELLDRADRRHGYPFINCTNCGPRYSILLELPYDRPHTTMRAFTMCPSCGHEYHNPADRRFHAQPNACPACGPQLALLADSGNAMATHAAALDSAATALLAGQIVAVKGIGGFHLLVDAANATAVAELRRRKHRAEKPFAVMFPSLDSLHQHAETNPADEALLASPAAPIVLLRRRADSSLSPAVAPGNPFLGALLPYSPLHLLLLQRVGRPVVATSANLSEEPLCIDNTEDLSRLRGIADLFLVHDRPIAHPVDDSVVRPALDGPPIILRRARGYAPTTLPLPPVAADGEPLLCLGGHMKNTVALAHGGSVVLGPHIGDLATLASQQAFQRQIDWFVSLLHVHPGRIVCDAHPDYDSTRYARASGLPVTTVQHHLAHVCACLLDHPDAVATGSSILGVSWDGTGYGSDGTIWGGEFIAVDLAARTARRVAHLRPFRLPGGEAAVRDPRRSALGLLHELHGNDREALHRAAAALGFTPGETDTLLTLLARGTQAPVTTSAGRLFDGVAALLGLAARNAFEGQAAMQLEFAAERAFSDPAALPFALATDTATGRLILDWRPALASLLAHRAKTDAATLAARFHHGLAAAIAAVARHTGLPAVALTGGCFQNRLLLAAAQRRLAAAGHTVLRHRDLPPNDGNLAAGQALAARLGITAVE